MNFGFIQKKKFWLGHDWGHGLNKAWRSRSRPQEKNPINKRVGSRSWVQTHGSGQGMQKPGPNPTHCHSYPYGLGVGFFELPVGTTLESLL